MSNADPVPAVGVNTEIPLTVIPQNIPDNSIDYSKLTINTLQVNQYIRGGATGYDEGTGFWLGNDGDDYKFFIGNSAGNKITWDGTTLNITGSLIADELHAPDTTTADSFHVNDTGNMWIGCNVADFASANENAQVYFLNDGTGFIKSSLQVGETSTNYLTIDGANQRVRSSNYVSGVAGAGFTLEPGLLEVGNAYIRGKISTAVFQKDVISSVGGNLIVLNSDVLAADLAAVDTTLTISGDSTFAQADRLRMKDGINDEYMIVTDASSAPTYGLLRDVSSSATLDLMNYATSDLIRAEWVPYPGTTHTAIDACNSVTGWGVDGVSASNLTLDTTNELEGTGCLNFDTLGAGTEAMILQSGLSLDISSLYGTGFIIFPIYLPTVTGITSIEIHIASAWTADRDYKAVTTDINGAAFHVGWNIVSFDTSAMNHAGTFDPSAVTHFRIDLNGTVAAATDFLIDDIAIYATELPPAYVTTDSVDPIENSYWGNFMNTFGANQYWIASPTSINVSSITGAASGAPSGGRIGFWIKVSDISAVSYLRLYVGSGGGDRIYNGNTAIIDQISADDTVTYIELDLTDFSVTGTPDWTAVDYAALDCGGTSGFTFEISSMKFYSTNSASAWTKGATVVSYGQPEEGGVLQTSSETNSPYLSIFTHDGEPWDTINNKARLGNLSGITDATFGALSGYGLWTDSGYFTGSVFATGGYFGDSTNRVAIESAGLNVGSTGSLRGGQTAYGTGTGFWMGYDSGAYKLSIGSSVDYFKWDGTDIQTTGIIKSVIKKDAGENISAGEAVYLDSSSGDVYLADASDVNKVKTFLGIALTTATTGNSVTVQIAGVVDGLSGLTAGSFYFITDTPGAYDPIRGTYSKRIGQALSTTELQLDFSVGVDPPKSISLPWVSASWQGCWASDHTEYPRYIYLFSTGANYVHVKCLDTANGLKEIDDSVINIGGNRTGSGGCAVGSYVYWIASTGAGGGQEAFRADLDLSNRVSITFKNGGVGTALYHDNNEGMVTDGTYIYTKDNTNVYQWTINGTDLDLVSTSAYTTTGGSTTAMYDSSDDIFLCGTFLGGTTCSVDYFDGTTAVGIPWWDNVGSSGGTAPYYGLGIQWINGTQYTFCTDGQFREYDYRTLL